MAEYRNFSATSRPAPTSTTTSGSTTAPSRRAIGGIGRRRCVRIRSASPTRGFSSSDAWWNSSSRTTPPSPETSRPSVRWCSTTTRSARSAPATTTGSRSRETGCRRVPTRDGGPPTAATPAGSAEARLAHARPNDSSRAARRVHPRRGSAARRPRRAGAASVRHCAHHLWDVRYPLHAAVQTSSPRRGRRRLRRRARVPARPPMHAGYPAAGRPAVRVQGAAPATPAHQRRSDEVAELSAEPQRDVVTWCATKPSAP
jgi:hypothetical protein